MAKSKRGVRSVRKNKNNYKKFIQGIETYVSHEKIIALILGVLGVALIASSGMNLNGGVIGTAVGKNILLGLIGAISFLASLVLLIKRK
ncbi:MAG: hypothetical protein WAU65_02865 [Candidatus Nanoarchaeia archaeon]